MKGQRVTIPGRLLPYLGDMHRFGLWGITLRDVIVNAVQSQVQEEVRKGAIPQRINGKPVSRRRAPV